MRKGHRTYTLADKIDRKRHLEEGFHLTRLEIQLLHKKREPVKIYREGRLLTMNCALVLILKWNCDLDDWWLLSHHVQLPNKPVFVTLLKATILTDTSFLVGPDSARGSRRLCNNMILI